MASKLVICLKKQKKGPQQFCILLYEHCPSNTVFADLLRMFFDALCDEDVIMEEAFYKWESGRNSTQ